MLELFSNPVTLFKISLNSKIASHFHLLLLFYIYQYTCKQCSATYIGETKKQLKVRISQHKGISFRTNRPLSSFDSSKIYEHAFDNNHPISDDSFKILSNSNVFDLKVLESLYIHKLQPNLNDYNSSFDLHIVK